MKEWDKGEHNLKLEGVGIKLYMNDGLRVCLFAFDIASKEKGLNSLNDGLVRL